ncbi:DNA-binding transcriptional regulator, MarR family [Brevibacterium sp. Mu109]|uniref:MarR family winged helix-turn-helix transcriptional regulator n=1 Tax=Brevibacterium sp. Mu109 TaxID=1255669 RepID=UPI000C350B66|nr:MarR family transcriptional regulator [Brevibacterium sp. Mu109]SMX94388.1 DNA-binding transcriptional regulator, MarR family [Brevibacterium sp. Mu109]
MHDDSVKRVRAALQHQIVHAILGNELVARQHGLRVTDLQTLHLMVLRDDIRTPRQISTATGMPTSTVTKVIDRLEQAGYVRRAPDPSDRRKTRIELIDAAIAPLQTLYGTLDSEFDAVSGQFSTAELDTVARYLDAVNAFYAPTPPAIE